MNYYYPSLILNTQEDDNVFIKETRRLFKDDNRTMMMPLSSSSQSGQASVKSSCEKSGGLALEDGHNKESNMFEKMMADSGDADVGGAVEPTPIDRSSAVFVDTLDHYPLDCLLVRSKQDEDNYDFFIKTFSSSLLVTTTEQTQTPARPVTTTTTNHPSSLLTLSDYLGQLDQELLQFEKEQELILLQDEDFVVDSFENNNNEQTQTPAPPVTTTTTNYPSSLLTPTEHPGQLDHELLQFEKEQELILLHEEDFLVDTFENNNNDDHVVSIDQEETETSSSSHVCSPSPSPSPSLSSDSSSLSASSTPEAAASGNHMTHVELWNQRYQELIQFKELSGHCLVPLNWPMNPPLARWVKRQRYQYQIKYPKGCRCRRRRCRSQKEQQHCCSSSSSSSSSAALTDEREQALEHLGFTWDSHALSWQERLGEFLQFQQTHGHDARIPKKCIQFPQLPIWVKRQRRQYQLWKQGKKSQMTQERLQELLSVGFCFGRSYPTTTNNTNTTTK